MQGRRAFPENGFLRMDKGDYGKYPDGDWWCCTPNGHMGNLKGHDVVEHEDGTITVSPLILVEEDDESGNPVEVWHGYLERGVWREV